MELTRPSSANSPYESTVRIYVMNGKMIRDFSTYLGSTNLDFVGNKLFVDAASFIISASVYPWVVAGGGNGTRGPMSIGGKRVVMQGDKNLNVWQAINFGDSAPIGPFTYLPYQERDIGMVHIDPFYHDFRDYSATSISLWVPLVGFIPLDPTVVTGHDVYVTFVTDYAAAQSVYYITVDAPYRAPTVLEPSGTDPRIIHTGDVNVEISLPLGASNAADIKRNQMSSVSNAVMSGAQGVLGGAINSGTAGALLSGISGLANVAIAYGLSVLQPRSTKVMPLDGGYVSYTGCNRVTAVIERRDSEMPANYAHSYGRPLMQTRRLSTLTGYTKVARIHPEGIPCTAQELSEIEQLLLSGVIL